MAGVSAVRGPPRLSGEPCSRRLLSSAELRHARLVCAGGAPAGRGRRGAAASRCLSVPPLPTPTPVSGMCLCCSWQRPLQVGAAPGEGGRSRARDGRRESRDPGGARRSEGAAAAAERVPGGGRRRREPAAARHHAATGDAGDRPGIYRDPSVLHEPGGGRQFGGWECEGNPSQPCQEKRRRRTRRAERVMGRVSFGGAGLGFSTVLRSRAADVLVSA